MRWFLLLALLLACRVVHAEDYRPTYEQYKALCAKGRYQEALPLAEQALRLSEKEFGEAHENTAVLLVNLGLIYERLGDYEKAAQLLRRSVDIELRLYGKDSPKVARAFEDLGRVYESLGEYGIAEIAFSRALQIYRSKFGADDPKAKSVASLLARVISRSRPQGRGSLSEAEPPKAKGQTKPTRPSPVDPTPVGTNLTAQTSNADEPQLYRRSVALAWVLLWLGVICLAFWFPGTLRSLASRVSAAFKRLAQLVNAAMKKRAQAVAERQERLRREQEAERQRRQEKLEQLRAKHAEEMRLERERTEKLAAEQAARKKEAAFMKSETPQPEVPAVEWQRSGWFAIFVVTTLLGLLGSAFGSGGSLPGFGVALALNPILWFADFAGYRTRLITCPHCQTPLRNRAEFLRAAIGSVGKCNACGNAIRKAPK